MDKLYSLTATQMKDLLDKKEVTSVEITKSVIDRIEKTDKEITAYTSYNFENALKAAETVDEKRKKGEAVVNMNYSAVERGRDSLVKVNIGLPDLVWLTIILNTQNNIELSQLSLNRLDTFCIL